jgi:hypothetical protein
MKTILTLVLCVLVLSTEAQLNNFSSTGKTKRKLKAETIEISIAKPVEQKQAAIALASVLSNLIPIGVNAIQTALSNRQESFTATYSEKISGDDLITGNSNLNIASISVKRITTEKKSNISETASEITLDVEQSGPVFRFSTKSLTLKYSKARLKKCGKRGKSIDLDISIKVDALYKEFDKEGDGFSITSATLGESSVHLTGIIPQDKPIAISKKYSDWYKLIPAAPDDVDSEKAKRGWYTITVTVKEANPYGVTSKKLADFFKENSEKITTVIQGFIPKSGKDEEKEKGDEKEKVKQGKSGE